MFWFLSLFLALRTECLGDAVAFYQRPFEARATDPTRREVFRHQGSVSAWFTPVSVPQEPLQALAPARERSQGPLPRVKRRRREM